MYHGTAEFLVFILYGIFDGHNYTHLHVFLIFFTTIEERCQMIDKEVLDTSVKKKNLEYHPHFLDSRRSRTLQIYHYLN